MIRQTNGLVQRRAASSAASGSATRTNDNESNDADEMNHNGDFDSSKETRFTLMEEVLLLGLKDKEVGVINVVRCSDVLIVFVHHRVTPPSGTTASLRV